MFADTHALPTPMQAHDTSSSQESTSAVQRVLSHVVDSGELLKGQKTVDIVHNGLVYRLQATKLGKLILTK